MGNIFFFKVRMVRMGVLIYKDKICAIALMNKRKFFFRMISR